MIQIKQLEERGKSKRGLRYSEHLHHFFSLLSDSSREYQIFKNMFVGMDLRSIRYFNYLLFINYYHFYLLNL